MTKRAGRAKKVQTKKWFDRKGNKWGDNQPKRRLKVQGEEPRGGARVRARPDKGNGGGVEDKDKEGEEGEEGNGKWNPSQDAHRGGGEDQT